MTSDLSHRWQQLGERLIRRRLDLDPRYRNRQAFADDRGVEYRIVSDFERARRDNFHAVTIAEIERAYELAPGAVSRFLAGGELEERPLIRRREIDFSGPDKEALAPYRQAVLRQLYSAVGLAARFPVGDVPELDTFPGIEETLALLPASRQPFSAPEHEADAWNSGLMLSERVTLIARMRLLWDQADEAESRQTGLAADQDSVTGPVRGLVSVAGRSARASH